MLLKHLSSPACILFALAAGDPLLAQSEKPTTIEDLKRELRDLESRYEEDTKDLRLQIEDIEDQIDQQLSETDSWTQNLAQSASAFNPAITLFGNFIVRLDDKEVFNAEGDRVDDRFLFRETELDFRASIDPWADGVIIVALESEAPGEFETLLEEGYLTLKKLPFLDSSPLGIKLKVGRFRSAFGRFNRLHTHDLPQTTRPPSLRNFLGEEGFVQDGLSGEFFIPTPGESNSLQGTIEVINGGDLPVADENNSDDLAVVGRLNWFVELGDDHTLDLGTSVYHGKFDEEGSLDTQLYGLDVNYHWKPTGDPTRSVLVGGEAYYASIDETTGKHNRPFGGFVWCQVQLNASTYLGARYDHTEDVVDDKMDSQNAAIYLSYYTSEFLRLRVGYERNKSDFRNLDNLDSLFVEFNFVLGAHPPHPHWVNK